MSWWPEPQYMVLAAGPSDTVIDIRADGQYDRWHGSRDGLTCLECELPVHPRRYHKGTPAQFDILAHTAQDGIDPEERCASLRQSGSIRGRRRALAHAVAHYLTNLGYSAETNVLVGEDRVDVIASTRDRQVMILLQLETLAQQEAIAKMRRLRSTERGRGAEVLWLTYGCAWVDRLRAVGIRFVEEPIADALEVGGVHAIIDAGFLRMVDRRKLGQPVNHQLGLAWFLTAYMHRVISHHQFDIQHVG